MKAYTDISQSKKLAEILPIESADMYYQYVLPKSDKIKHIPKNGNPEEALEWYNKGYTYSGKEPLSLKEYCIPAWSLAALIGVVSYLSLHKTFSGWRCDSYNKEGTSCILGDSADNPVDACYEAIVFLHEQKLL